MTRAEQVAHAVSALRAARAAPDSSGESASMAFLVYEDNGGTFHWTIVADSDEVLARSPGFGSREEAERAASLIHHGVLRASFDPSPLAAPASHLSDRPDAATTPDRQDAERWTDEGGSLTREAVSR